MAALTRLEPATARARSSATSSLGAPLTRTSRSLVAPSPSAAISLASSSQTAESAAVKRSRSGPGSESGALAARPLASAKTTSFVLMSPSTVRALKLFFIAADRAPASAAGEMAQSVVTTAIIVASEGAGDRFADGLHVDEALRSGERVGVAAVDDHGPCAGRGEPLLDVEDRRGPRFVLRQAGGGRARRGAVDERQVLAVGLDSGGHA